MENGNKKENQSTQLGIYAMTMIGVGYAITINNFTVGANAGLHLTFSKGLIAIFVAWICLSLVWIFSGMMGAITHKNAAIIFRHLFGSKGGIIPSLCTAFCNWVWAIFDYWYVGSVFRNMFPNHQTVAFVFGIVLIVGIVILGVIKDITSLKWLTALTVPVSLLLFLVILVTVIARCGGISTFLAYHPTEEISLFLAINMLFGSFIAASGAFSDITYSAKSKRAVIIAMPIAMGVVCFQFLVAQFGAIGLACVDLTSLALSLGGAIFYVINFFVILGQSNTSPSSSLIMVTQLSETFHLPRIVFVFIQPIVAGILSCCVEFWFDVTLLNSLANVTSLLFGPLLAAMFCEFYVVRRSKIDFNETLPKFSIAGILTVLLGMALGGYLTYFCPIETPISIITFVFAFAIHYFSRKVVKIR